MSREKLNTNPTVYARSSSAVPTAIPGTRSLEGRSKLESKSSDALYAYTTNEFTKQHSRGKQLNFLEVSDFDCFHDDDDEGVSSGVDDMEPFDNQEIFDLLKDIQDPEHPLTLEQLNVVQVKNIFVGDEKNRIRIYFTPTVPHCSMSTLIGLCIRVKLLRSLPTRFKVDIFVEPGSHSSEEDVNKQLNDKERVAAALENSHLITVVNKCLSFQA